MHINSSLENPRQSLYPASLRLIFPLFPWAGSRPGSLPDVLGPPRALYLCFRCWGVGGGWNILTQGMYSGSTKLYPQMKGDPSTRNVCPAPYSIWLDSWRG